MVMSRSTAVGSIVTGSIMLCFAIVTVICGAISAKKLTGQAAASAGLWSLYYAVPGILSIVAGASKNGIVMGFALFFNIIAVILSCAASIVLIIFTAALNQVVAFSDCHPSLDGTRCTCPLSRYDDTDGSETWDIKCSDLNTLHTIMIAMVVVFVILTITTFTASIFGCLGTCCAPVDPVVVVTGGAPAVQAGSTVVVATNQSSMMQSGYPGAYGYPQPPAYGDKQGLVPNMAI